MAIEKANYYFFCIQIFSLLVRIRWRMQAAESRDGGRKSAAPLKNLHRPAPSLVVCRPSGGGGDGGGGEWTRRARGAKKLKQNGACRRWRNSTAQQKDFFLAAAASFCRLTTRQRARARFQM